MIRSLTGENKSIKLESEMINESLLEQACEKLRGAKEINRVERRIAESPSHTTVQAMSHTAVSDLCLTKDVCMEKRLFFSKYFKLRAWCAA